MAVQLTQEKVSPEAFDAFIQRPENQDCIFELINGEIVEVPSNAYASKIAAKILTFIGMYLLQHDIGHVTGADGGYMVGGHRFAPDVAYISYARQAELATRGYNPNPPELAVEVISDAANTKEQRDLRLKLVSYLAAGVTVWIVDTEARIVEIHQPGKASQLLDTSGIISGGDMLPGFELPIKDIFPQVEQA